MAAMFLLLVAIAIASVRAQSPFAICTFFGPDNVCYDCPSGNCAVQSPCPAGTTAGPQFLYSWPACNTGQVCCQGTPTVTTPAPSQCSNDPQCGQWGPTARLAISNTQIPRQSPYQVSLRRIVDRGLPLSYDNTQHFGGGVLVQNKWVLTDMMAALSTGRQQSSESYASSMIVVLGDYNISVPEIYNGVPQEQWRRVRSVSFHPGARYTPATTLIDVFTDVAGVNLNYYQDNAFCLIELEEPVIFNDWIRPICLPPAGAGCRDGSACRITGWGIDEDERLKNLLQVAYVNLFTKDTCETVASYGSGGATVSLPVNTRCASNAERSYSCLGDFGGPLACDDPTNGYRATLYGIMTFNQRCTETSPILISDVGSVVDWIWGTCEAVL